MYKILNTIGEPFTAEAKKILAQYDVTYATVTQGSLAAAIARYDAVICGLGVSFNDSVLRNASNLTVIATATTGLDHIDVVAAKQRGIEILSLRDDREFLDSITSTAELSFALMLSLVRRIPFAFDHVRSGRWERDIFRGHSVPGKVLGIVGAGRLGRMMAHYGSAFGMSVLITDPHVEEHDLAVKTKKVSLDDLLNQSDVISIHVHLDDSTKNLFDDRAFSQMKRTAYLVNTSRGEIVNEAALLQALTDGRIAGYATDVLSNENEFEKGVVGAHPLVAYAQEHQNCIIVPHIGGMTHESREATDIRIAKLLTNYLH